MAIPNFIPLNSTTHLRRPEQDKDWLSFLDDLTRWVDEENNVEEIVRHRKWERNIRFYRGSQVGYIPSSTGIFQDIPVPANSTIRINNILRYFVDNIVKEIVRSQASFTVAARKENIESQGVARLVRAVIDDIQKNQWTSSKKQAESKYTILCGNSFRYSTYSYENSEQKFEVAKYENKTIQQATRLHVCEDCGSALGEGDLPPSSPQCECGSSGVLPIDIPEISIPVYAGTEKFPVGDVRTDVIDPMEVKLSLHCSSMEESPYIRRSRMVLKEFLQGVYSWAEIESTVPNENHLIVKSDLERLPGNVASGRFLGGSATEVRQARFDEYWIEPILYGTYKFPVDTQFMGGKSIPAGTKLLDIFPNGLYIAKSLGKYMEIKEGIKNAHWVHVVWNKAPSSVYGDGIDDAIEKQKQHNDAATLVHDNLMNNTAPPTYYNPLKINRGQITAKPGFAVPMKNAGPQDNPANFIFQMQPRQLGSEIHQVLQEQKGDMAMLVGGAFSTISAGGQDGNNPSTATGLAIIRDSALSHLAPFLDLKGEADVKMVRQWLKLIHKYQIGDRVIFHSSDYTELENKNFKASILEEELDINIRPGSLMPRTELERRNDIIEAMAAGGLPLGVFNPQMPQKLRQLLADRFNLPFDAYEGAPDERIQAMEIETLMELAAAAEKAGASYEDFQMEAAQVVFPKVFVDGHDYHIAFVVNWLKKDKGLKAHKFVKDYLVQHIQEHIQAKGQLAQQAQQLQMAAMGGTPSQVVPQTGEQAGENQSGAPFGGGKEVDVQALQKAAGFDQGGNVSADTRPNSVAAMAPGAQRVTPVTAKTSQSQAPQPT